MAVELLRVVAVTTLDLKGCCALTGLPESIDGLAAFFEGGAVPVEAELTAAKGRVAFTGRTSPAGDAAGQIVAGLPSAERFARAAGLGGVAPPEGLGRSITASGKMVLKGGTQLSLRQLDLRLDHNALMVDADLDLAAERPAMTARIAAEMQKQGVYVTAFSFPVVPRGQDRIRTQMSAAHGDADIDAAIDAFAAAGRELGVIA